MKARILVVDDEETAREELCEALRDAGYEAVGVGDGRAALAEALRSAVDVCLTDIRMPGLDGLELLRRLREASPETPVIMVTAYGDMHSAIEALRSGAVDYLLKPLLFEDVLAKVHRLVAHRRLEMEVRNLRLLLRTQTEPREMVGESAAMRRVAAAVRKVAPTAANVLISGESGTGKELVARGLHAASPRRAAPFVPVNCAAIPETLLESELFGHAKGAFTGAETSKEGLFRTAGEGTLFLDEVGDMPPALQAKLLRAVETKEIQPLGSARRIPVRARIVAATNQDLRALIRAGRFREDLYYRLAVVELEVPPLRERREDIPRLVEFFVARLRRELRRPCRGVTPEALRLLVGYEWPGNVRELENTLERALILADGEWIRVEDLPETVRAAAPVEPGSVLRLADATRRFEAAHIRRVLEVCGGDKRRAARLLGVSLSSLYRKLARADASGGRPGPPAGA